MRRVSAHYSRPVGKKEKRLDSSVNVRYLFAPGELEGGGKKATDPNWCLKVFNISASIVNENEPVLYYLKDGPKAWICPRRINDCSKGNRTAAGVSE